ncbi:MAG: hypothetical protein ISS63_07535 [Desulfobacteraceae bacterium]|nr:hypothetical protein [Desulfobacteraceae bacterium]
MYYLIPIWQKRRSEFSHDWLKNKYIPALGTFLNILDQKVEDAEFQMSFLSEVLPQWKSHRDEAFALPREFIEKMSPKVLVDHVPLSFLDDGTKMWLRQLVHGLWVTRYPIKQWVFDAYASAHEVNAAYDLLKKKLKECQNMRAAQALTSIRDEFVAFRKQCQNLARAIEKFPSEVKAI